MAFTFYAVDLGTMGPYAVSRQGVFS
ncbi:uncharacterized protein FFB20_15930 [Fusarium fujikuroi]|nr:uncharacterized protein FFB20_05813 [Fusarium fujikuroi]SCO20403.1 uncharacterized protein FFB20_15930 [Fusarium fujikuroi]SCO58750.1 uncharacterized protein FFMR_15906 [Fusarium fujikuroi]